MGRVTWGPLTGLSRMENAFRNEKATKKRVSWISKWPLRCLDGCGGLGRVGESSTGASKVARAGRGYVARELEKSTRA